MVGVRGGIAQPVVSFNAGAASIITGTTSTVGLEVVPARPTRQHGVWVQATSVSNGRLLVGSTSADAKILLDTFGVVSNAPNIVFIPGTGAVYIKSWTSGTPAYTVMEY